MKKYHYIILITVLSFIFCCVESVFSQENYNKNSLISFATDSNQNQRRQYSKMQKQLNAAMNNYDIEQVNLIVDQMKSILGNDAGKPRYPDKDEIVNTKIISSLKQRDAKRMLGTILKKIDFASLEYLSKGQSFPNSSPSVLLRKSARIISVAIMVCEFEIIPELISTCQKYARIGLDNLIKLQLQDGSFPTPDFRGTNHNLSKKISKLLQKGLIEVRNGWCVRDLGFGGFQMDAGILGETMIQAYHYFQDERYLNCAIRAANWARDFKPVPNWNYNAFSMRLLAKIYQETSDSEYLDACRKKIMVGILPGQTENGRWLDPQNALIQYHMILMSSLLETYPILLDSGTLKEKVREAIIRGIQPVLNKNLEGRVAKPSDSLVLLLMYARYFGSDMNMDQAINTNLTSIINSGRYMDNKRYPKEGISRALTYYLYKY
ncbi:putative Squalene cyclase C-terminal domain-containing protein [Candidatus Magnetomoraceae bacterium gMMP-1]